MQWLFLIGLCAVVVQSKIPDYIPSCSWNDPNLSDCVLKAIETLRPRLNKGIPEINFPAIEPFLVRSLKLNAKLSVINLKGTASHIVARGGSGFKINSLTINKMKLSAEMTLTIPRLELTADYSFKDSKFWAVSAKGTGKFTGVFEGVDVTIKAKVKVYSKGDSEYLKVKNLTSTIVINNADMSIKPDRNSPTMIVIANIIKNKGNEILKNLRSTIDEQAGPLIKKYANDVLKTLPLDRVLAGSYI